MGEFVVGGVSDIPEGTGRVVELNGRSIGVFHVDGRFYALRNYCPHQGGPVCTGKLFPTLSATIHLNGKVKEYFDYDQMVVCCPWHGWEFHVETGECVADKNRKLAVYETKVVNGEVVVIIPER